MSRLKDNFFSDSYLMPTKLEGFNVENQSDGKSAEVKGIVELKDTDKRLTLDQIKENLNFKNVVADRASSTYFAIPSPMANVISFENLVRRGLRAYIDHGINKLKDMPQERNALNEWLGILSLWTSQTVLKAYGINISAEIITLSDEKRPLHNILSKALGDLPLFEKSKNSAGKYQILIISQDNIPFAIFHPQLLLCPFRQYPVDLFKGKIQWYDCEKDRNNSHNCWVDMLGNIIEGKSFLPEFVLERLILWVARNRQNAGDSDLMHCLLQMICPEDKQDLNILSRKLKTSQEVSAPQNIELYITQLASTDDSKKKDAGKKFLTLDGQVKLPDVFLPQILLVNIGSKESRDYDSFMMLDKRNWSLRYEGASISSEELASVVPLLPCGYHTMAALESQGLEIEKADFVFKLAETQDTEIGELERIQVAITLRAKAEQKDFADEQVRYEITHTYYSQQIITGVLPFVAVWPYVSLPADTWKNYYGCSAVQWKGDTVSVLIPHDATDPESGARLTSLPEITNIQAQFPYSTSCCCKDFIEAPSQSRWELALSETMFHYVSFNADGRELGSILIEGCSDLPEEKMRDGEIFRLGVDLGSTSTLCGYLPVGSKNNASLKADMLEIKDYARTITYAEDDDLVRFTNSWWLPKCLGEEARKGKFLTIAQLFQCEWMGEMDFPHRPYADGRICFMDSDLLNRLAKIETEEKRDPLRERKIFNNIKESEGNSENEQGVAARIFMTNLLMFGVLEGLSRGYYQFELRCSYPSKGYLGRLSGMWQNAVNNIRDFIVEKPEQNARFQFSFNRDIYFFTEAKSVMSYQRNIARKVTDNYVIVDIGGGTTDVSLIGSARLENKKTQVDSEISLKYAGRQLVNDSIAECMRYGTERQRGASISPMSGLWKANTLVPNLKKPGKQTKTLEKGAAALVTMFESICASIDINGPHAIEEYVQIVDDNSTIREIIEVLLDKVGVRDYLTDEKCYVLRNVIAFKYHMLFYMIANYIKLNFDKIQFKKDKTRQINIFIAGTGAKGLEIVMGRSLGDIDANNVISNLKKMILKVIGQNDIVLNLILSSEVEKKKEVCLGMLHLEKEEGLVINEIGQQTRNTVQNHEKTRDLLDFFDTKNGHRQLDNFINVMEEYLKSYDHDAGILSPQDDDFFTLTDMTGEMIKLKDAASASRFKLMQDIEITSIVNTMAGRNQVLENIESLDHTSDGSNPMGVLIAEVYLIESAINRNIAKAQIAAKKRKRNNAG